MSEYSLNIRAPQHPAPAPANPLNLPGARRGLLPAVQGSTHMVRCEVSSSGHTLGGKSHQQLEVGDIRKAPAKGEIQWVCLTCLRSLAGYTPSESEAELVEAHDGVEGVHVYAAWHDAAGLLSDVTWDEAQEAGERSKAAAARKR